MQEITRVGVDLAKRVIQVLAVNAAGLRFTGRALQRDKFLAWCAMLPAGCLVAMEASSSAHHWARKLIAMGLDARIIAAHLVTPYRMQGKGGKNDANDAAAICEAASRPQMHFVAVKSVEQQSMLSVHRLREGFKTERVACINRIRGVLAEFGLVFPQKPAVLRQALPDVLEDASNELGGLARMALQRALTQWQELDEHLQWCDQRIAAHLKANEQVRQAQQLMGVGPINAVPKALKKAGMGLGDVQLIEFNEAFSAQALAVIKELGMDTSIINVNGGAIALGHPLGATGAKLTTQLVHELRRRGGGYGMVTMCIGGGMGAAGIFEVYG